jgi:hypothetical protein
LRTSFLLLFCCCGSIFLLRLIRFSKRVYMSIWWGKSDLYGNIGTDLPPLPFIVMSPHYGD